MKGFYEWVIGARHLRSTHRRGFVSFVALISVLGLMLGVATLIVVLSAMNGFERELRTRILNVTSHGMITGPGGTLPNWREVQQVAAATPHVTAAVPYIEAEALFMLDKRVSGAMVRGVLPEEESRATGIAQSLTHGRLEDLLPGKYNIILGNELARELNAKLGSMVVLIAPQGTATPTGVVPRQRRFKVVGLFESGMYEFDRGLALTHMKDAALLYRMGTSVSGVRLAVDDPFLAWPTVNAVGRRLQGQYYGSDWRERHENFFRAIELTKSMLFMIVVMIVAVAAFNIVSTLVMIVKEKQTDIAILRTLGAGPRNILAIFSIQGVMIGLAGTALGAGLGILVSHNLEELVRWLERMLGMQLLDPRVYKMSELPAYVEWVDVIQVCVVAFALCTLATIYPAWRASRTQPAEALRHDY
jgi:lipoprotein-releasing system permease protein